MVFIDSFSDNLCYIGHVNICVQSFIRNVLGSNRYSSKNFSLRQLFCVFLDLFDFFFMKINFIVQFCSLNVIRSTCLHPFLLDLCNHECYICSLHFVDFNFLFCESLFQKLQMCLKIERCYLWVLVENMAISSPKTVRKYIIGPLNRMTNKISFDSYFRFQFVQVRFYQVVSFSRKSCNFNQQVGMLYFKS